MPTVRQMHLLRSNAIVYILSITSFACGGGCNIVSDTLITLQESGINLRNIIWSSVLIYLNVATRSFGWSQSNYREGRQVSDWIGLTCYSL